MRKKVKMTLDLEGPGGNAFSILGAFRRAARHAGWSKEEIDIVFEEATSSDYEHLLETTYNLIEG